MFAFIVSWQKGCTCDHSELIMNITVSGTTFNIRNLEPDTTYKICVSAVSISDRQEKSEMKCLHTKTLKLVCKCYSDLPHTVRTPVYYRTHVCTFIYIYVHHAVEWHAYLTRIHVLT